MQYLQYVSNGDTAVLYEPTYIYYHSYVVWLFGVNLFLPQSYKPYHHMPLTHL